MDENPWPRLAVLAATLVMMGTLAWWEMPQWQRELIRRGIRRRMYRLLHRVARASGRRAMGDELAGRQAEADAGYAFTETMSRLRDRA